MSVKTKIVVIPGDQEKRAMEMLELVCAYWAQERQSPSIPELKAMMGKSEGAIHEYIAILKKKNLITKLPNFKRSIRVIDPELIKKYQIEE